MGICWSIFCGGIEHCILSCYRRTWERLSSARFYNEEMSRLDDDQIGFYEIPCPIIRTGSFTFEGRRDQSSASVQTDPEVIVDQPRSSSGSSGIATPYYEEMTAPSDIRIQRARYYGALENHMRRMPVRRSRSEEASGPYMRMDRASTSPEVIDEDLEIVVERGSEARASLPGSYNFLDD